MLKTSKRRRTSRPGDSRQSRTGDESLATVREIQFCDSNKQWRRMLWSDAIAHCRECLTRGETAAAQSLLRQLLEFEPADIDLLTLLLNACKKAGNSETAIEPFRNAIALQPGSTILHSGFGLVLAHSGDHEQAVTAFREALRLDPANYIASFNLGAVFQKLQRDEEAVVCFEAALSVRQPEEVVAKLHACLGVSQRNAGRPHAALTAFERALDGSCSPSEKAALLSDVGAALAECGYFDQSLRSLQEAVALAPTWSARCDLGLAMLLNGDFANGFSAFEARLEYCADPTKEYISQVFPHLRWNGEDLTGKRILLCYEQGLGDTIHFARYARLLKDRGAAVVLLSVQDGLKRLFSRLPGVDAVLTEGEPVPAFDLHCPLTSVPLACGTTLESIPNQVPYLYAEDELRREWRAWLGSTSGLKVGLCWAGNPEHKGDRDRSMPLEFLRPLLDTPNTTFYSVQVGPRSADIAALALRERICDVSARLDDFAQTAAALAELDLLITVDTSVAHLAGAMGVETWLLLPVAPDWRWLLERNDSPWYPTLRLFRQATARDWPELVERVRVELRQRAKQDRGECVLTRVTNPQSVPCKVCAGDSPLFGVVDFHKNCMEAQGKRLELSGTPIYYRRCTVCGFLFSDAFDGWSQEALLRDVYNAEYLGVDPGFAVLRPVSNARMVAGMFGAARESIRILDYGRGSGLLATLLRTESFVAATYDPFSADSSAAPPERFDLVTCFDVLQHQPFPGKILAQISSLLNEQGVILFSTLLQPAEFAELGVNWWYAGPRNGHISLYSRESMIRLFQKHGFQTASFSDSLHLAFREIPNFAAHLLGT